MAEHRLPGMSISADEWRALTERAEVLGTTRTELIREAIARTVAVVGDPEVERLQRELRAARRQLSAIRAALNGAESVAA